MPTTKKEFREFFLRETQVTSGSKPDQESGFPITYFRKGVKVFNRFLRNHFPSEDVMKKFLESIAFKLNVEDTATATAQGLIKKSSDADAEVRTLNPSSEMAKAVVPHQLPEIVLSTDINDTAGTEVKADGISVTPVKRTLSTLFRRNYWLKVLFRYSITTDATTKQLQLVGDVAAPGNSKLYGTDSSGNKGWYSQPAITTQEIPKGMYLNTAFAVNVDAGSQAEVGSTLNILKLNLDPTGSPSGTRYKFEALIYATAIDATTGLRIYISGDGVLAGSTNWFGEYLDYATTAIETKKKVSTLAPSTGFIGVTGPGVGVFKITGTVTVTTPGYLIVKASRDTGGATTTQIGVGSYIIAQKLYEDFNTLGKI
jgi:hypothetical protein